MTWRIDSETEENETGAITLEINKMEGVKKIYPYFFIM